MSQTLISSKKQLAIGLKAWNRPIVLPGLQEKTWKTQKLDYLSSWGSSELLDPIFGVSEKVGFAHDGKNWEIDDDSSVGGENSFGW